jgi:hypothetical protein
LYWAVAEGATGDGRQNSSSSWEAKDLPADLWELSFPNGLNFAYADCNGDGKVNEADRNVIENNYGLTHGVPVPDDIIPGVPGDDPALQLSAEETTVAPRGTLVADLSLGAESDSIMGFYGIAFTVIYDPDVVDDKNNDFQLAIPTDSWISGQGNEKVLEFINNDTTNGIAEIAVIRRDFIPADGAGEIGKLNIVMEDIIIVKSELVLSEVKMITPTLESQPVVSSKLTFSVDSTVTAVVQPIQLEGIQVYPNPVNRGEISISLEDSNEGIRYIQLFDTNGRLLQERRLQGATGSQRIPVGHLAEGFYTFKVLTDKRIYVRSFVKGNDQ